MDKGREQDKAKQHKEEITSIIDKVYAYMNTLGSQRDHPARQQFLSALVDGLEILQNEPLESSVAINQCLMLLKAIESVRFRKKGLFQAVRSLGNLKLVTPYPYSLLDNDKIEIPIKLKLDPKTVFQLRSGARDIKEKASKTPRLHLDKLLGEVHKLLIGRLKAQNNQRYEFPLDKTGKVILINGAEKFYAQSYEIQKYLPEDLFDDMNEKNVEFECFEMPNQKEEPTYDIIKDEKLGDQKFREHGTIVLKSVSNEELTFPVTRLREDKQGGSVYDDPRITLSCIEPKDIEYQKVDKVQIQFLVDFINRLDEPESNKKVLLHYLFSHGGQETPDRILTGLCKLYHNCFQETHVDPNNPVNMVWKIRDNKIICDMNFSAYSLISVDIENREEGDMERYILNDNNELVMSIDKPHLPILSIDACLNLDVKDSVVYPTLSKLVVTSHTQILSVNPDAEPKPVDLVMDEKTELGDFSKL